MSGHKTSDATRRVIGIVQHARASWVPSLLLSLDAEKAFDQIHWQYMHKTLKKFGFTGPILSAILALYSMSPARVYTVLPICFPTPSKSQMDTGRAALYPIRLQPLIEPLTEAIRASPQVAGFTFQQNCHTINLFADNIIIFLTNPESSLAATHKILTSFTEISYYKVNFTKSLLLDLGIGTTLCNKLQASYPYTWSTEGIPYLGIHLIADTL